MSGGSLDYFYQRVSDCAKRVYRGSTKPLHQAFASHLHKIAIALHDLEWVLSGDYEDGKEDVAINAVLPPHAEQIAAILASREALDAVVRHYVGASFAAEWTSALPTAPGWYWIRWKAYRVEPERWMYKVTEVVRDKGALYFQGCTSCDEGWGEINEGSLTLEWQGPIRPEGGMS